MSQYPIFFPMGALAAHTAGGSDGFRPKEVRFFAELFSNWIQLGGIGAIYTMHNTQIARFMTHLVTDSQAQRTTKNSRTTFRLTRTGLFALVSKLTSASYLAERSQCSLIWYFLKSYAPQIREGMAAAANEFSRAHKIEMESILDTGNFLRRQIQFIDYEIVRISERVEGAEAMSKAVLKLKQQGVRLEQIIETVTQQYPYELNSQLPFKKLLLKLPEPVIVWELDQGAQLKGQVVFDQLRKELLQQREHLSHLLKREEKGGQSSI